MAFVGFPPKPTVLEENCSATYAEVQKEDPTHFRYWARKKWPPTGQLVALGCVTRF